jgi:hypothetical protein
MIKFVLTTILFFSFGFLQAQNFPVAYKIQRNFKECNQCEVKSRSDWSLVNPESYSEKIREAIVYKIFVEKSYPEKVGYYFGEQDYEKACEISRSGKHVWKDKVAYLTDNMSIDYFSNYEQKKADEKEKLRKEEEEKKLAKEKDKKQREDSRLQYEKDYSILEQNRKKASLLLENKDIDTYLVLSESNCIAWRALDSLYTSSSSKWYYIDTGWTFYYDVKKLNYNDYYSDVNSFASQALFSRRFDKVRKATYMLIKDGESFRRFQVGTELEMSIARYSSHGSLLSNDREWFWFTQRAIKQSSDQNKSEKWCKLMIDDFNKFEELGILKNTDTLKLIVKAWTNQLSVRVSQNASEKTKNAFENNRSLTDYIKKAVDEEFSAVKSIDKNLFLINFPPRYSRIYFYLNKNGDLFMVNYSTDKDPSNKKWAKLKAKSKEIRDKDLGIIPK